MLGLHLVWSLWLHTSHMTRVRLETTDLKNKTGSSNLHSENEAGSSSRRPYWSDHLSSCANRPAYVKWQTSKKFSFNFQRV